VVTPLAENLEEVQINEYSYCRDRFDCILGLRLLHGRRETPDMVASAAQWIGDHTADGLEQLE
jgi:hypothetical protein